MLTNAFRAAVLRSEAAIGGTGAGSSITGVFIGDWTDTEGVVVASVLAGDTFVVVGTFVFVIGAVVLAGAVSIAGAVAAAWVVLVARVTGLGGVEVEGLVEGVACGVAR